MKRYGLNYVEGPSIMWTCAASHVLCYDKGDDTICPRLHL
jgi:hypothetical protein